MNARLSMQRKVERSADASKNKPGSLSLPPRHFDKWRAQSHEQSSGQDAPKAQGIYDLGFLISDWANSAIQFFEIINHKSKILN
jgi:hypothetical protein